MGNTQKLVHSLHEVRNKLLKTVQTMTTFRNPLADPLGTRRGPPLVCGPQFENRCVKAAKRLLLTRWQHGQEYTDVQCHILC